MNNVTLIGRVGRTPELADLKDGKKVAKFSLATTEFFNGKKETTWHNIEIWGEYGETISKLVKTGNQVGVFGRIKYTAYEKNDVKCVGSAIVVNKLELLDSKNSGQNSEDKEDESKKEPINQNITKTTTNNYANNNDVDDLPF